MTGRVSSRQRRHQRRAVHEQIERADDVGQPRTHSTALMLRLMLMLRLPPVVTAGSRSVGRRPRGRGADAATLRYLESRLFPPQKKTDDHVVLAALAQMTAPRARVRIDISLRRSRRKKVRYLVPICRHVPSQLWRGEEGMMDGRSTILSLGRQAGPPSRVKPP